MSIKGMELHKFSDKTKRYSPFLCMEKNYPFQKIKGDLDVELLDGTEDKQYLDILDKKLNIIFDKIKPEFVFYLSGVDILKTDNLGG